jgi:hypothetical protein
MNSTSKLPLSLSTAVSAGCLFLIGQLVGIDFGYRGALLIENPESRFVGMALHGSGYFSPIYWGYIIGGALNSIFLIFVLMKWRYSSIRLLLLAGTIFAISRGLYNKLIVISRTGEPGFLNPYSEWIPSAIFFDCLLLVSLFILFGLSLWNWYKPSQEQPM